MAMLLEAVLICILYVCVCARAPSEFSAHGVPRTKRVTSSSFEIRAGFRKQKAYLQVIVSICSTRLEEKYVRWDFLLLLCF